MLFGNTIEFTHMALGLVPEIFNAIDVIVAVCKELGMLDPEMLEGPKHSAYCSPFSSRSRRIESGITIGYIPFICFFILWLDI